MKKILVFGSLIGLIGFGVACTPKKMAGSGDASSTMLTKELAATQFSNAQIAEGQTLYNAKCQQCHKLHDVGEFSDVRWNRILNKMLPKAKATPEEAKVIRAYVIANSKSVN